MKTGLLCERLKEFISDFPLQHRIMQPSIQEDRHNRSGEDSPVRGE